MASAVSAAVAVPKLSGALAARLTAEDDAAAFIRGQA